jgi:hypothetical protein
MKRVLTVASVVELATGVALLVVPVFVGRILLGAELAGVSIPVARVAGIALIALGIACLPGKALLGMSAYGTLVTLYLAYVGIADKFAGILLWPAVAAHAVLTLLLGQQFFKRNAP